jgi:hypothetical protein
MKINDDSEFDDQKLIVRGGARPFASKQWSEIPLAQITGIELQRSWPGVIGDLLLYAGALIFVLAVPGNYVTAHPDANVLALIALIIVVVLLVKAVRAFFINWTLLVSTAGRQYEVGANSDRSHAKATALKDQLMIAIHKAIAGGRP